MRKLSNTLSVLLFLMISTILFSTVDGNCFWYGDPGDPIIPYYEPSDDVVRPLHDYIHNNVYPRLTYAFLTFDNRGTDRGLTVYDKSKAYDGYTLLGSLAPVDENGLPWELDNSVGRPYSAILIDMEGNIVNKWQVAGFPAKMLPGGYVMGGVGTGVPGHLEDRALVQQDWCGNEVWRYEASVDPDKEIEDEDGNIIKFDGGLRMHHDFQREGNPVGYYAPGMHANTDGGKTLILIHDDPDEDTSHISNFPLEDDAIREVDWEGNVIWEWHPYEHFDECGFSDIAKEAIMTIQSGAGIIGATFPENDWQHINAVSYLGPNRWYRNGDERFHPDNIIWDGRTSNMTAIVARYDDPEGRWQSGDIVWKIGPDFVPGTKEHRLGQIIGQHMAHMIPQGLPGEGNILMFDNGGLAGWGSYFPGLPPMYPTVFRDYSRVIEFNPVTMEMEWEYVLKTPNEDGRKFFSWFISGAQRLKNGNTMITEGSTGRVFEVTQKGEIVWEYISPFGSINEQTGLSGPGMVYRAYRVPKGWVPQNAKCEKQK
ncbi:aryl-sulfate sulfotransferase [Desulfococcus multivorans]|uniref:Arylsulfotransferase n=1 Tax=Desulfococcus multivorans DSM 2059 TaxID=1121405 RepID=S7U5I8_DESML|nr:aryl-sulfate sulfotransferase [Desulfococcus multivorans]AOY60212.1 conserved uncharacterized protein [Desulfococcus multivorans]EPR44602.1 hypothetical protein dsmv_1061 [Desulfococcus multivorans DSM 2059]SKA06873.1 Arylsulfotransferase (ASST) [Desulfococcus multivorans DSM 2059]